MGHVLFGIADGVIALGGYTAYVVYSLKARRDCRCIYCSTDK